MVQALCSSRRLGKMSNKNILLFDQINKQIQRTFNTICFNRAHKTYWPETVLCGYELHVPEIFLISPTERPVSSDLFFRAVRVIATAWQITKELYQMVQSVLVNVFKKKLFVILLCYSSTNLDLTFNTKVLVKNDVNLMINLNVHNI